MPFDGLTHWTSDLEPQNSRQNSRLGKISKDKKSAFLKTPQVSSPYQENARLYGGSASGKTVGRYIESDPLGLAAGSNLYGYASQNPTERIDPSGEVDFKRGFQISTCIVLSLFCPIDPDSSGLLQNQSSRAAAAVLEATEKAKKPCKGKSEESAGEGSKDPEPEPEQPKPEPDSTSSSSAPGTASPLWWLIFVPFPGNPIYFGL